MIKPTVRELMNAHLRIARETPSESQAQEQLDIVKGMIGYAVANGDITPQEHANEWVMIRLVREQRINERNKRSVGHA